MKLRTNLSPDELEKVAAKLTSLAKSRRLAEKTDSVELIELSNRVDKILHIYKSGLREELDSLLSGDRNV